MLDLASQSGREREKKFPELNRQRAQSVKEMCKRGGDQAGSLSGRGGGRERERGKEEGREEREREREERWEWRQQCGRKSKSKEEEKLRVLLNFVDSLEFKMKKRLS